MRAQRRREGGMVPLVALATGLLWLGTLALGGTALAQSVSNHRPAFAFDPNHNHYLLVWQYEGQPSSIKAQLRDPDGALVAGASTLTLSPGGNAAEVPSVAFDSVNNDFLAVWREGDDIASRMVGADGSTMGPKGFVTSNTAVQTSASVAFDPINQHYLVVWDDARGQDVDIYGQLLNADGSLYDPDPVNPPDLTDNTVNFAISTASGDQTRPRAAFDLASQRFLVVWEDARGSSVSQVYGQLLDKDGNLVGTDAATNIDISSGSAVTKTAPSVADDPYNGRFLVAWQDDVTSGQGSDIYGRLVQSDGSMPAAAFAVTAAALDQTEPSVAYDATTGGFQLAYTEGLIDGPLYRIDPQTLMPTYAGPTGVTGGSLFAGQNTLAYDANSNVYYVLDGAGQLYSLDPSTHATTAIGSGTGMSATQAFAWNPADQKLYAVGLDSQLNAVLYTINTHNGNGTAVGTLAGVGENPAGVYGMAFDANGTLYGYLVNDGDLVTIDTSNQTGGTETLVDSSQIYTGVSALTFGPDGSTLYGLADRQLFSLSDFTVDPTGLYDYTDDDFPYNGFNGMVYDPNQGDLLLISGVDSASIINLVKLDADGATTGGTNTMAYLPEAQTEGKVFANPFCANSLLPHTAQVGQGSANVVTLETAPCTNTPVLTFEPGALTSKGVVAGSMPGDTFTFQVVYASASNTPPSQAELWIDLTQDGTYAANAMATRGWPLAGPGALALAALLGLGGLALLRWPEQRRPVAGLALLTLALGLTGAGLVACNSSTGSTGSTGGTPGIAVTPTSGLTTTEAGGTATFTVVLDSQPTADVSIPVSSSNTNEGTVSPSDLVFTASNWNTAQTVTVTGVADHVVDGNVAYTIVTAPAVSDDSAYNGLNADDVAVTDTDSSVASITVTPTSGLTTTEAGGTATFTVVLATQPTADVTLALSSSDINEGTVSPASLTFTADDWDAAQTVTVTGVPDKVVDGNVAYTIVTAPAVSNDGNYSGLDAPDVAVTNVDDSTAGIAVSPTSGLTTTEAGDKATFTVVLATQPTADVTIALSSNNTNEGTVSPASLTFTAADWDAAQTVTVTGVADNVVDGDVTYTIVTAPAQSQDGAYNGLNADDVSVTNTDISVADILVTPTSGLTTTESGGTATFTVVLATKPSANVTIALSSSNTDEGTVSPASLTFTQGDWDSAQTVTVTGVQDGVMDGNTGFTIVTAPAVSDDGHYNTLDAADVSVTNIDVVIERYAMTPVDPGDTNYADGRLYTVSVPVPNEGSYHYKFVFNDGTRSAVGTPSKEATLSVIYY